jgi:mRNA interferase MazF
MTAHGELWWADADKRRPVVIVSRDDRKGVRDRTTVAFVTSTRRGIPPEVDLDASDGLERPSVANCDELVTMDKDRLVRRIGQLSQLRLADLHRALRFALAITPGE